MSEVSQYLNRSAGVACRIFCIVSCQRRGFVNNHRKSALKLEMNSTC